MRICFPNRVEFPNAPFGFAHMLNVFNGLGVTALSDLWINAHVWVGDQRLQVPALGGRTAQQLVESGEGEAVVAYLRH